MTVHWTVKDVTSVSASGNWQDAVYLSPTPDIVGLIGAVREEELKILDRGLKRMRTCIERGERLCVILAKMYGRGTLRVCGGCDGADADRPRRGGRRPGKPGRRRRVSQFSLGR